MKAIKIVLLISVLVRTALAQSLAPMGTVITVDGDAFVLRGKSKSSLEVTDNVFKGDIILTQANAQVRLLLKDESILDIKEKSRFALLDFKKEPGSRGAQFEMDFGSVRTSVNKKLNKRDRMEIKTRSAVFAVRGTDFNVTVDESQTAKATLSVFKGRVGALDSAKAKPKEKSVQAKQQLFISPNQPEKLLNLTNLAIDRLYELSRVDDRTVVQDLVFGDLINRRSLGVSSLRTLNRVMEKPVVGIPASAIRTPNLFHPTAQAIAPATLNLSNIQIDVGLPQ